MLKRMKYTAFAAAAVLLAACSEDEPVGGSLYSDGILTRISVVDSGFAKEEGSRSDAAEKFTFAEGDAIGVFAVRSDGSVINECKNIKFTYTASDEGSIWYGQAPRYLKSSVKYYAYYPYNEANNSVATLDAINALPNNFTPNADQSTREGFAGSDFMLSDAATATATTDTYPNNLTFTMCHKMALVKLVLPRVKYTDSSNNDRYLNVKTEFEGNPRYCPEDGNEYYYIVFPGSQHSIDGGYTFMGKTLFFPHTINSTAEGKVYTVTVDSDFTLSDSEVRVYPPTITADILTITGSNTPIVIVDNVSQVRTVKINGDVTMYIFGNCSFDGNVSIQLTAGITVNSGTLTIEAGDNVANLTAKAAISNRAGIELSNEANLIINSGTITATGSYNGAGIGTGSEGTCGNITINGGTVTATGKGQAAGIGASYHGSCKDITIKGGTITATGNYNGAGIGTGGYESTCGNITIKGGTITATGGSSSAGIGTSYNVSCGNITITSGTIIASGGSDGAGIGTGGYGTCGNITITGRNITATGGSNCDYDIGTGSHAKGIGTVDVDTSCLTAESGTRIYENTFGQ